MELLRPEHSCVIQDIVIPEHILKIVEGLEDLSDTERLDNILYYAEEICAFLDEIDDLSIIGYTRGMCPIFLGSVAQNAIRESKKYTADELSAIYTSFKEYAIQFSNSSAELDTSILT